MAPGYGLAENVCLATFASQDYRTLKLDYEAYQKNCAVLVTEEKEGEQVKEIVSVGAPVKDLNVVIANPKTKKPYPDLPHRRNFYLRRQRCKWLLGQPERKC